ncbi:sulfotransferase family protein [Ferrimonas marina]|uniref:Sulfotransferase domain-containing protein n=1 Tax=Ferrimonas marina TaxID=299255 RepID=A0A1M5VJU6_9GAMM|nr:sulfotransferase [Ferrimonas marina]SHH75526.1 Sulfotransferase domain-containing protein [Ferrimonas marina]
MNFFIVGGQRCGTTWLYDALDSHNEICMAKPVRPEPKYFLKDKEEIDKQEYLTKYFDLTYGCLGEKSTSYYETEAAALNIKDTFPDAKIVFCLRNPVDRAISNYFFSKQNGLESRDIESALFTDVEVKQSFSTSVSPFDYLSRGFYSKYIEYYVSVFGKENVYVTILEDLVSNHEKFVGLLEFIGVSSNMDLISVPNRQLNESKKEAYSTENVRTRLVELYRPEVERVSKYADIQHWTDFVG